MIMPFQEELREVLEIYRNHGRLCGDIECAKTDHQPDLDEALSAINSLTLKQVLALIGEDEPADFKDLVNLKEWELMVLARNELKAELRQSAERIWK